MTVSGGAFTKILLVFLGGLFMAASLVKSLRIRGVLSRSPGVSATATSRVLVFLIGLASLIEGVRLLFL
jgi:hypothetical protein